MPRKAGFSGASFSVIVDGRPLPEVEHNGKTYIAAPVGKEFEIEISVPRDGRRYECVLSVDGLSVMNGQVASSKDRGYVVVGSMRVPGFRLDNKDVAHFEFLGRDGSYAALTGKPTNIGVIGMKVFAEKCEPVFRPCATDVFRDGATRGMPGVELESCGSKGLGHDAGTGFGRRTEHNVTETSFDRSHEVATLALEYATAESLRQAGIPVDPPLGSVNPFPGDPKPVGCTPPAGWRG